MPHDITLIATVAAAFGLAMLFGVLAVRLRLPPLAGYLLAGVVIGPATPGFVADVGLAGQLAEIGVMLLMFGVGLHFSVEDLVAVRRIAIPGAIAQILVATALGAVAGLAWGWGLGASLVFGLCLSVASTVVLLRALQARGELQSVDGQIAIGWLVVEDLVMVLVLVLLPAIAGVSTLAGGAETGPAAGWRIAEALGVAIAKIAAFVALMFVVGRRLFPRLLWVIARTGSQELFTLTVIAVAIGVAFGAAKLFDVSFALGAFFAGMMMRESEFSHRAADESLPLRDAFAVLFFVSVGMLFDPAVVWEQPGRLLLVVAIILLGKTVAAVAIVLAFRYPLKTALTVGASLAQIGEFSFILAGLGVVLGLLPAEGRNLVLAAALISIAANAALLSSIEPLRRWLLARSAFARTLDRRDEPLAQLPNETDAALLSGQVVLCGHGALGSAIADQLIAQGVPLVVVDQNRERVDALREQGVAAVVGDASQPEVLVQAHVARAALLVSALPQMTTVRAMSTIARTLNPGIRIVVAAGSADEADLFDGETDVDVLCAREALASGVVRRVHELRPRHG